MSSKTSIGWTDRTWNPTTGCDKVSPGCDNCYALSTAKRNKAMRSPAYQLDGDPRTSGPGFALQMHPHRLGDPFKWPDPERIFVNSMSDLFHKRVEREFIAQVFAVMAMSPHLTYQILTKRHARMRSVLSDPSFQFDVARAADELLADIAMPISKDTRARLQQAGGARPAGWPLPNVWLGVSVEDQTWANNRIPELIATPAAVRFLSCEPLLGPVDLSDWLPPRVPVWPDDAPAVWSDWRWDDWVPQDVRMAVEDFWPVANGGPRAWLRDALQQGSHAYGQAVSAYEVILPRRGAVGKWVHARGNIGRLVHPDGSHTFASFGPEQVRAQRHLHWVIAGGESGRGGIRPMHPEWVRGLHRQTEAGGAQFFMKQLGTLLAKDWGATGKGEDPSEWQVPFPQDFPEPPMPSASEATIETGATA